MDTMRALRVDNRAAPSLEVTEVPVPEPAIGDVLVRVEAASLTPTELGWPSTWVDRRGVARAPSTPCHELCGEVVALGYGTFRFAVGDRVYGLTDWYRDGAAAEYVAVEARDLAPSPASCRPVDAATVPLAGLSAWQALFERGSLARDETVVVTGAAGGVGVFALQLAREAGATVIAAGRAAHEGVARELGADEFVDLSEPGWPKRVDADLALDLVGGAVVDELVTASVARRIVSLVAPHDAVDFFVVEPDRPTLEELARRVDAGTLRPVVADVVPLAESDRAFAATRGAAGKRVIEIA
ncbi:MAG TPA: NADP-dependent oxidoreductase [Acidimicrobiia bacterium]|nr:NADP-dependent oxidoreductase [Acidimicrobiia bacterium]